MAESEQKELFIKVGQDPHPLIKPGVYEVTCVKCEKGKYYSTIKLYVTFCICTQGEFFGVKLFKPYNFYDPLPRGSDLLKDLAFISGRRISKNTKLSLNLFKGKIFQAKVRTVTIDRKQVKLSEAQQYSVVDKILKVIEHGAKI